MEHQPLDLTALIFSIISTFVFLGSIFGFVLRDDIIAWVKYHIKQRRSSLKAQHKAAQNIWHIAHDDTKQLYIRLPAAALQHIPTNATVVEKRQQAILLAHDYSNEQDPYRAVQYARYVELCFTNKAKPNNDDDYLAEANNLLILGKNLLKIAQLLTAADNQNPSYQDTIHLTHRYLQRAIQSYQYINIHLDITPIDQQHDAYLLLAESYQIVQHTQAQPFLQTFIQNVENDLKLKPTSSLLNTLSKAMLLQTKNIALNNKNPRPYERYQMAEHYLFYSLWRQGDRIHPRPAEHLHRYQSIVNTLKELNIVCHAKTDITTSANPSDTAKHHVLLAEIAAAAQNNQQAKLDYQTALKHFSLAATQQTLSITDCHQYYRACQLSMLTQAMTATLFTELESHLFLLDNYVAKHALNINPIFRHYAYLELLSTQLSERYHHAKKSDYNQALHQGIHYWNEVYAHLRSAAAKPYATFIHLILTPSFESLTAIDTVLLRFIELRIEAAHCEPGELQHYQSINTAFIAVRDFCQERYHLTELNNVTSLCKQNILDFLYYKCTIRPALYARCLVQFYLLLASDKYVANYTQLSYYQQARQIINAYTETVFAEKTEATTETFLQTFTELITRTLNTQFFSFTMGIKSRFLVELKSQAIDLLATYRRYYPDAKHCYQLTRIEHEMQRLTDAINQDHG